MTSMFYLDRNEMCDVRKVCSLTFEIELNRFYLWMVVQNTTSNIRQYLGVTLTILMKMHYRLVGVGCGTNMYCSMHCCRIKDILGIFGGF